MDPNKILETSPAELNIDTKYTHNQCRQTAMKPLKWI